MSHPNVDSNVDNRTENRAQKNGALRDGSAPQTRTYGDDRDGGIRTRDPLNPISVGQGADAGMMPPVPSGAPESAGTERARTAPEAGTQHGQQHGQVAGLSQGDAPAGTEGVERDGWLHVGADIYRLGCSILGDKEWHRYVDGEPHRVATCFWPYLDALRALTARAEAAERGLSEYHRLAAMLGTELGYDVLAVPNGDDHPDAVEGLRELLLQHAAALDGLHAERAALAAKVAAATPALRFAGWVLDQWQDEPGDLDAGDVEAQLIASGLYAVERRVVPCGDDCSCRESADEGEATDCNRHTAASRAALRALTTPALPAPAPTMAGEP